ncbi:unnamed protein product [Moneuplotes crassus]|uniref:Uncharacterized protein n=1 Tax=Euplotes crassus TaxID=5936 RepID=A0AAD1XKU4_EUPCR|nr:unnamed protein product [Moneuplotes crassus]
MLNDTKYEGSWQNFSGEKRYLAGKIYNHLKKRQTRSFRNNNFRKFHILLNKTSRRDTADSSLESNQFRIKVKRSVERPLRLKEITKRSIQNIKLMPDTVAASRRNLRKGVQTSTTTMSMNKKSFSKPLQKTSMNRLETENNVVSKGKRRLYEHKLEDSAHSKTRGKTFNGKNIHPHSGYSTAEKFRATRLNLPEPMHFEDLSNLSSCKSLISSSSRKYSDSKSKSNMKKLIQFQMREDQKRVVQEEHINALMNLSQRSRRSAVLSRLNVPVSSYSGIKV